MFCRINITYYNRAGKHLPTPPHSIRLYFAWQIIGFDWHVTSRHLQNKNTLTEAWQGQDKIQNLIAKLDLLSICLVNLSYGQICTVLLTNGPQNPYGLRLTLSRQAKRSVHKVALFAFVRKLEHVSWNASFLKRLDQTERWVGHRRTPCTRSSLPYQITFLMTH